MSDQMAEVTITEIDGKKISPRKVPAILEAESMAEMLKHYEGHPVCICAARYHYRGIVRKVTKDSVLLTDATQIDVTGLNSNQVPTSEDLVTSSLILSLMSIETVYQPDFCFGDLPGTGSNKPRGF